MRTAALILGIIGGLIAGALGGHWLTEYGKLNELQRAVGGESLRDMGTAGLLLIGSMAAGLIGGVMAFKRKFLGGAVLMLTGAVLPPLLARQTTLFILPLLAGGIIAGLAHVQAGKSGERAA